MENRKWTGQKIFYKRVDRSQKKNNKITKLKKYKIVKHE